MSACARPTVRVGAVEPGAATVTGAVRRIRRGDGVSAADLVDAPVVPTLTWSERPPGIDDATVWQELATQAGVQRLSSDGRPLAVVPFTVLCDGRLFTGTAESWEAGGGGTLNCAVPVEREASAAAQRADADYC